MDALFLSFQEALVGKYSLERELGRGGMGVVYLAREVRLDRPVAIKLLPPELAAHETLRERFLREARIASRLSHPYIIPIHSVDEVAGFVFYVMAYVDGETLADRVRARGPLPPNAVSRIMREVAWALAYAHAQHVVHRDVKAANIMLERGTERALVMDFGIAQHRPLATTSADPSLSLGMTKGALGMTTGPNEVLGTPEYMSPEQACGEAVDGRSDLYSLGIVGWFALTGTLPFTGGAREVLAQQVSVAPPPVGTVASGVTRALGTTIDRCLAKDPSQRFATGEAVADALAQSLEKKEDVPVPLRVFLDARRNIPLFAIPAAGMMALGGTAVPMFVGGGNVAAGLVLGTAGIAMIAAPAVIMLARLRKVMRLGYGADDIVAAARALQERQREEFLYDFGTTPSTRERAFGALRIGGFAVAAAGAVGLAVSSAAASEIVGPIMVLGAYAGILGALVSSKWRRLRQGKPPRLAKIWNSRMGRGMVKLASINIGQRAIPADRPTELGIAMSAESLYDGFDKELKKSLGDVPAVLRGLESHARSMRARMADLDASIQDAQGNRGRELGAGATRDKLVEDLRSARAQAEQRLADVVSALETVRLGLLRLHAGAGSAESITQDLNAARALGDDVDRLIAGSREADKLLGSR